MSRFFKFGKLHVTKGNVIINLKYLFDRTASAGSC